MGIYTTFIVRSFNIYTGKEGLNMKLITIFVLAALLLISNCAAISFVPTADDLAWSNVVVKDSNVISSDMGLISFAATNMDMIGTKKYCDLTASDMQDALENSQMYRVSRELQETKDYWEQALVTLKSGSEKVSRGCTLGDATLITQGSNMINKGNEYVMLATRALKIALE
jgi:hypothetical protein